MKAKSLFFVWMVCLPFGLSAQSEFPVYDNGLIYSPAAMGKLRHIVDSLNLKFANCVAHPEFHSFKQGRAHYVYLENAQVKEARAAIAAGIPYDDFLKKFPDAERQPSLLVMLAKDHKGKRYLESMRMGRYGGHQLGDGEDAMPFPQAPWAGKWVFRYHPKSPYSEESISAFYFVTEPEARPLAESYARKISYADCLVDTTAQVFRERARERNALQGKPIRQAAFRKYLDAKLKKPGWAVLDRVLYDEDPVAADTVEVGDEVVGTTGEDLVDTIAMEVDISALTRKERRQLRRQERRQRKEWRAFEKEADAYFAQLRLWEPHRLRRIDSLRVHDAGFQPLFDAAVAEAMATRQGSEELEELMERYGMAAEALELKRNRIVVGGCSMDDSPREHAKRIAVLAAETTKWEIFLRSHLDIMNDNFDRVSDGSWAWERRDTYIRELEVLDIDVPDLLIGVALRIDDPAPNHYFGSIGRLGRAIAGSSHRSQFEDVMADMMADGALDEFNRVLSYYLFNNYVYSLPESEKTAAQARLDRAMAALPSDLVSMLRSQEE